MRQFLIGDWNYGRIMGSSFTGISPHSEIFMHTCTGLGSNRDRKANLGKTLNSRKIVVKN